MANKKGGAIYIGVTAQLITRVWQHKNHFIDGHTSKYKITQLVYYEQYECIEQAILREKRMKKWKRQWKVQLIEELNPNWIDLWDEIIG